MRVVTAVVSPSEVPTELRMPPAVAEWLAEQGPPPIGASKFEHPPRPARPGCHDLEAWRQLMRLPEGWPHAKTQLAELSDGLEYDEYGVIVLPEKKNSAFRRHAARHTTAATA